MTAQDYIQSQLDGLAQPLNLPKPKSKEELVDQIFKLLMSKKYRKYSVTPQYSQYCLDSIKLNVNNDKPINVTFLGGCYKLWRLPEAPESDWGELFAGIYYSRWLKPIATIYEPGIWFDYFLDDVIVSKLNNISEEDVEIYRKSRQTILDFLRPYQPKNMRTTLTGVSEQFKTKEDYEQSLSTNINKLREELPGGLPILSAQQAASTTLNVKTIKEQEADPMWREKVELLHSAYMMTKAETGYSTLPGKVRAFTQPLSSGTALSVGTTKDSVAKFWAGVGALKPKGESYRQLILSPKQLATSQFKWEPTVLDGLSGKNFSKIRVLKQSSRI